jgi:signal transduction histidine kinase
MQAIKVHQLRNKAIFEVNCPEELYFQLDKNAWYSIISNLIDNALKYAGETPKITISCEQTSSGLKVQFEDNGSGVPPEKINIIFQRFARLGNEETRSAKGVGLGLYIVRELIRAMHGDIKAENVATGGLKFTLNFQRNLD